MNNHTGFGGQGFNGDQAMAINTADEVKDEVYDPTEWVWKWNKATNPDADKPKYVAYDKDTSMKIEEAFQKFKSGDTGSMLYPIN